VVTASPARQHQSFARLARTQPRCSSSRHRPAPGGVADNRCLPGALAGKPLQFRHADRRQTHIARIMLGNLRPATAGRAEGTRLRCSAATATRSAPAVIDCTAAVARSASCSSSTSPLVERRLVHHCLREIVSLGYRCWTGRTEGRLPVTARLIRALADWSCGRGQRPQQMAEPERRACLAAGGGLHRNVAGSQDRAPGPGRSGDQRVVFGGAQWREPAGGQVGRGPDSEVGACTRGAVGRRIRSGPRTRSARDSSGRLLALVAG
jgi:hypothetical protein